MKISVIDIGSNSVRLMLWADGKTLYKKISTTRLGEGLAHSGRLGEAAMARTSEAVRAFLADAEKAGTERTFVFATAAVRTAENGAGFCARVKAECGAEVDVVSGEREALLGISGALGTRDGGVIDIGGGSTEICFREEGELRFCMSLPVGAVRLYELCGENRIALTEQIDRLIAPLRGAPKGEEFVCAVGGTATTLACVFLGLPVYDAEKVQACILKREEVGSLSERLLSMTVCERREIPGMDVRRADIIAGGALLLHKIMTALKLNEVHVSDRDNLEGYLAEKGFV